jgi:hypothetical protein
MWTSRLVVSEHGRERADGKMRLVVKVVVDSTEIIRAARTDPRRPVGFHHRHITYPAVPPARSAHELVD